MLIVVEGVSAAGKTSWASRCASVVVDEITGQAPEGIDVSALGQYWSGKQRERWQSGLMFEALHKRVCFDTDPLKVHYPWCLWQVGLGSREVWIANALATRECIANKQLGFADQIVLLEPAEDVVRLQKANDSRRRRSNFETNLRLREPLRRWYVLLEALSPKSVVFNAHQIQEMMPPKLRTDRYNLELFDALIEAADHQTN